MSVKKSTKIMKNEDSWCVNPYMNLDIHPSGMVKPCCMSNIEYVTDQGSNRLNQASIKDFWNSKSRLNTIKSLNDGIKLEGCKSCWDEENAGKESKRIRDNKIYSSRITDDNMKPIVLALSLGNLCNIKCRICSPVHSTPWMLEQAKILFKDNIKLYYNNSKWKSFKESFSPENTFIWKDLKDFLKNVERLDFAGGEPFYIENHWDIIKFCVEKEYCKNQYIHYNTNGTIYPEKYIDLLKQFQFIDIQISTDGIKEKFEYLRHPAKWGEVENNLHKFINLAKNNTNWMIGMCYSISAFNVFDFFETFEYYTEKNLGIYINIVHDHHGIRVLPPECKKLIIEHLESQSSKINQQLWQIERDAVCHLLRNTQFNEKEWKNFVAEIRLRDDFRNESFERTFPEYYDVLKKYM